MFMNEMPHQGRRTRNVSNLINITAENDMDKNGTT